MPTLSSQPENREQTFDEKLRDILLKARINSIDLPQVEQAIKTLVLEDVVGEDVNPDDTSTDMLTMHMMGGNIVRNIQRQIINPQKEGK